MVGVVDFFDGVEGGGDGAGAVRACYCCDVVETGFEEGVADCSAGAAGDADDGDVFEVGLGGIGVLGCW